MTTSSKRHKTGTSALIKEIERVQKELPDPDRSTTSEVNANKKRYLAGLKSRSYIHYRVKPQFNTPVDVYEVGVPPASFDASYYARREGVPLKSIKSVKVPQKVLQMLEDNACMQGWGKSFKQLNYDDKWLWDSDVDYYLNEGALEYLKREWLKSHGTYARTTRG